MSQNPYKDAGVDVGKGDALAGWLQDEAESYTHPYGQVVSGIGGFAGLFKPNFSELSDPHLVACTDGVGTKLLLAIEHNQLQGIGQDLVAMCLNDLYCLGARPLFFIDYFATGSLDEVQFKTVLTSIKQALLPSKTFLLGGETAELPGLYQKQHFDLAGFVVGVVDKTKMLEPSRIKEGDKIYAIPSSGFHSNGYSLIRKILSHDQTLDKHHQNLLSPTRVYDELIDMYEKDKSREIVAAAHITGGGISGNLARIIPDGMQAILNAESVKTPPWMLEFLGCDQQKALKQYETIFNLGIGMCLVTRSDYQIDHPEAYLVGEISTTPQTDEAMKVIYR